MPIETDEQDSFVIGNGGKIPDYHKILKQWIDDKGIDLLFEEFGFGTPFCWSDKDLMNFGRLLRDSLEDYWNEYNKNSPAD